MTDPVQIAPSKGKIGLATLVALVVAAVVLVVAVLPAEYGLDPLGAGSALGLLVLSGETSGDADLREDGIQAQPRPYVTDERVFEIPPEGELEYKYRLEAGRSMVYSWTANSWVRSEMHSEADDAPAGTAEFFEIEESTLGRFGTYTAPFPGIHGWYWKNESSQPVTLTLKAAGFFNRSVEYPPDRPPVEHDLPADPG